ncbi:copper amine oxidase N-terminal domain-containing protein [Paenibacillus pini]|uniref:Copper amine oxidase-like N-terminal domain-containing protein n=1 Tax=Paenibacillus pini JCM 16418 TaxID=1236976 RepID=W7YR79_9BACL|nr:copper amine oxidase N-terminal domain-containing protein [Paenibacillus pini]GAF09948.1 hypothetical protein JCM16418_4112 [Paenibacillus pini JCM 16418]
MKIKHIVLSIVVIISLIAVNNPAVNAASLTYKEDSKYKQSILLYINEFYLLYTTPNGLYIDKQNRTMVPLRSFTKLFGANASYDAKSKTAVVKYEEQSLKLTLNSNTIYINGEAQQMDTSSVMKNSSFYLPLKSIVDTFHIQSEQLSMNGGGRIIVLKDSRFVDQGPLKLINEKKMKEQSSSDKNHGVFPRSITLEKSKNILQMKIDSQNVVGQKVNYSDVDLGVWLVMKNEVSKVTPLSTKDYVIGKGDLFSHQYTVKDSRIGDVEYIVSYPMLKN